MITNMSDHQNSVKMGFFPTEDYVIRDLSSVSTCLYWVAPLDPPLKTFGHCL